MNVSLSEEYPYVIQSIRMRSTDAYSTLIAANLTGPVAIETVATALGVTRAQASEVGSGLVSMGLATRLRRGLILLKPPAEIGTPTLGEDAFMSAIALVDPDRSYIGFYTALHHHALVVRPASMVFIATVARRRSRFIGGTEVRFVTVVDNRIFGIERSHDDLPWSDPERTLVDGLARPEYCGQMDVVISAFHRLGSGLDVGRLRAYVEAYGVAAVAKRAEYIMERLRITDGGASLLATTKQRRRIPLDPHGPLEGAFVAHWELINNASEGAWHGE